MTTMTTSGGGRAAAPPFDLVRHELEQIDALLLEHGFSAVGMVRDISHHILSAGGKRLRPALLLTSARAVGCQDDWSVKLGACMELLHTATLMHDDVVDNSGQRRGRATAHERWGYSASVLSGDVMFAKAMRILVDYGDLDVLDAVTTSIIRVCEGEVLELAINGNVDIAAETYFTVIDAKTAALISVCCRVGALVGRAPARVVEALTTFGTHLGRAFQIMDDLMDLVADNARWGKPLGADLREGRVTLPIIYTLQRATAADGERLRSLMRLPDMTADHIQEAARLNAHYGGLEAARQDADEQVRLAKASLSVLPPSAASDALHAIADYAVARDQ